MCSRHSVHIHGLESLPHGGAAARCCSPRRERKSAVPRDRRDPETVPERNQWAPCSPLRAFQPCETLLIPCRTQRRLNVGPCSYRGRRGRGLCCSCGIAFRRCRCSWSLRKAQLCPKGSCCLCWKGETLRLHAPPAACLSWRAPRRSNRSTRSFPSRPAQRLAS